MTTARVVAAASTRAGQLQTFPTVVIAITAATAVAPGKTMGQRVEKVETVKTNCSMIGKARTTAAA